MILILPSLFGLTLVGEGLNKVLKSETQGWMSIIFGLIFIGVVVFAYLFFAKSITVEGAKLLPTPLPTLGM
jgi:hypothetical protein